MHACEAFKWVWLGRSSFNTGIPHLCCQYEKDIHGACRRNAAISQHYGFRRHVEYLWCVIHACICSTCRCLLAQTYTVWSWKAKKHREQMFKCLVWLLVIIYMHLPSWIISWKSFKTTVALLELNSVSLWPLLHQFKTQAVAWLQAQHSTMFFKFDKEWWLFIMAQKDKVPKDTNKSRRQLCFYRQGKKN